jgi:hypothetical protein
MKCKLKEIQIYQIKNTDSKITKKKLKNLLTKKVTNDKFPELSTLQIIYMNTQLNLH